jgi:hypothetical protein
MISRMERVRPPSLLGFLLLVGLLGAGAPSQAQVSFAPGANFATGLTPVDAALADLNADGKLDLNMDNTGMVSRIRDVHGRSDPKGSWISPAREISIATGCRGLHGPQEGSTLPNFTAQEGQA